MVETTIEDLAFTSRIRGNLAKSDGEDVLSTPLVKD
jgi:hypothetical protein